MCWGCFKEYTDHPVVNERVVAVYRLLANRGDAADSSLLHIIVADMNVDDHWLDLSNEHQQRTYDRAEEWERAIYDGLAALSEDERATAVAMEWGYLQPDGTRRAGLS